MNTEFGPFLMLSNERQVLGPDGVLELSARSFDILALLLAHPDQVLAKSDLFDRVWPGLTVGENTLQVHVSALRRALPEAMIVTVHGRGYKYSGPAPVQVPADAHPAATPAAPIPESTAPKPAIAILPFKNLSGDLQQDYFSDGITEDIIAELGNFRELLVIGRNSSFRFRGEDVDPKQVAPHLGVQYVVEGSVRKAGNRIRVTVALVDAVGSGLLWAEKYDRDLTDIFAIQDEIAQMISARLARQTRLAVSARTRTRPTDSMSAYDFYLRALQTTGDYQTMLQAEPFLLQALELDPDFAAAHGLLGLLHCVKFFWDDDRGHLPLGLALGEKAARLDSEEPYGHLAAGCALLYLRRFREAEASLDRAFSLNPNDPVIRTIRALLLTYTGRPEQALAELEEARRRDPFALGWFTDFMGIALFTAGRYQDAVALSRTMTAITPWFLVHLIVCFWELGDTDSALSAFRQYVDYRPHLSLEAALLTENLFEDPAVHTRICTILRRVDALASQP